MGPVPHDGSAPTGSASQGIPGFDGGSFPTSAFRRSSSGLQALGAAIPRSVAADGAVRGHPRREPGRKPECRGCRRVGGKGITDPPIREARVRVTVRSRRGRAIGYWLPHGPLLLMPLSLLSHGREVTLREVCRDAMDSPASPSPRVVFQTSSDLLLTHLPVPTTPPSRNTPKHEEPAP